MYIKKVIASNIFLVCLALLFILSSQRERKHAKEYEKNICNTKSLKLKGIIIGFGGHGSYHWVEVDNIRKSFSTSFSDIKYTKCFPDDYIDYQIGDSIIKEANSNKIIIKRDTCLAVYILDCDD